MELLGDVRLDRVEPQRRRRDPGEAEEGIAERQVDAEPLPVDLPREPAFGTKAEPIVEHCVVLDLRVVFVGAHLERHGVAEIAPGCFLEARTAMGASPGRRWPPR